MNVMRKVKFETLLLVVLCLAAFFVNNGNDMILNWDYFLPIVINNTIIISITYNIVSFTNYKIVILLCIFCFIDTEKSKSISLF